MLWLVSMWLWNYGFSFTNIMSGMNLNTIVSSSCINMRYNFLLRVSNVMFINTRTINNMINNRSMISINNVLNILSWNLIVNHV